MASKGIPSRNKRELLPAIWRPSFEFISVFAGIAVLLYYYFFLIKPYGGNIFNSGPSFVFLIISTIAVIVIIRAYSGIKMWFRRVRLYGNQLLFLTDEQFDQKMRLDKDELYLGEGYEWEQRHTQAMYEIKKLSLEGLRPPAPAFWLYRVIHGKNIRFVPEDDHTEKGAYWMHGFEEDVEDVYIPFSHFADHTLIPGTTGSGKTRLFEVISTQIIHNRPKGALIALDPKLDEDWWKRMLYECKRSGREDDFLFFSLGHPKYSIGINPLHNYKNPVDIANRLMSIIPKERVGKLDGFQAFMLDLITNIVAGLEIIGVKPTINNIFEVVESGVDKILGEVILTYAEKNQIEGYEHVYEEYLRRVDSEPEKFFRPSPHVSTSVVAAVAMYEEYIHAVNPSGDILSLIGNYKHDRTHAGKMIAPVKPFFRLLRSGDVGRLLSPDLSDADERPWWDMSKIIKAQKVLYVGTNALGNSEVASAVSTLLMADLTEVASDKYNYSYGGKHRITVMADEASGLMAPPFIEQLNKGRGAGIQIFMATQTIPDFIVRLGDEAAKDMVLGNVNQIICLRVRDPQTQEYVSQQLGETVLVTTQTSQSTSAISSDKDPTNFQGSYGERTTETLVPKISPEELGKLPNLEYIAIASAGRIIKGKIPIIIQPEKVGEDGWPTFNEIPWVKQKRLLGEWSAE